MHITTHVPPIVILFLVVIVGKLILKVAMQPFYRYLIYRNRATSSQAHISNPSMPVNVEKRIKNEKQKGYTWSSALSVNDFLLLKRYNVQPIRLVLGTSFFQNGFSESFYQCLLSSAEVESVEHAIYASAKLALRRLQKEAALVGAHAVVGIKMQTQPANLFGHSVECTFYGTAIYVEGLEKPEVPILCTVSVSEFVKLIESGSMPHGMAIGVGVFYERMGWSSWWKSRSFQNKEIPSYTEATYKVRHIAMKNLRADAEKIGGTGILSQQLNLFTRQVGGDKNKNPSGFALHFIMFGSIIIDENLKSMPITLALSLNK